MPNTLSFIINNSEFVELAGHYEEYQHTVVDLGLLLIHLTWRSL